MHNCTCNNEQYHKIYMFKFLLNTGHYVKNGLRNFIFFRLPLTQLSVAKVEKC